MAYVTFEQIVEGQRLQHAATEKARSTPGELTREDIAHLPGGLISDLMRDGQLVHLGIGGRRRPRPETVPVRFSGQRRRNIRGQFTGGEGGAA